MKTDKQLEEVVKLSDRFNDRLEVSLWWVRGTIDTYVEVTDYRQDPPISTIIPVPEGESPNDVFIHPFAYPARLAVGAVSDGHGEE